MSSVSALRAACTSWRSRHSEVAQSYELLDLVDASPEALYDLFEERGWGDGLPLVPPTSARVDALLEGCGGDPDEVLAVLPPRFGKATRRMVAVNAALAGCKPEYMPVLVAATGVAGIYEITTHLRGEAGDRQIEGAKVGLTHVIGLGSTCGVHILEKSAL